ncbi:MAG: right-handed parallel beta-helix repeat-containing protein [Bacteroidales bacterium]|nr:right-handed parallel beta-helix repeat-containing protein [Bacteroidales bacterium]
MKAIYFTIGLFFATTTLLVAQYSTPGTGVEWTFDDLVENSSGVVTEESGIYQVHADLTISESDLLAIPNAIDVEIAGGALITVLGTWNAFPAETASFSAIDPENRFEGFRFEETDESVFSNAVIEYGGGIKLVESDMEISDCIIRYFDKSYSTGAIDLFYSSADIHNNELYENAGPAVASGATSTSSPQIFNNEIYENNTSNANTPQINLGTSAEDSIRIVGNVISGLYDMAGGIAVTTLAGGSIKCVISGNVIENNRYGITCYGSNISSVIKNNQMP